MWREGGIRPEAKTRTELPMTINIRKIFKAHHKVEKNDAKEKHNITRLLHSRNINLQITHIVQYNAIFIISLFDRIEMWPLLALLLFVQHGWAVQCDKGSGPSGATGCIQMSRYNNQYQRATCLTNIYNKQKSGHKKECIDNSRIYCWYQCMLEVYNQDKVPLSKDCSCNPSLFTASTNISSVLAECYSQLATLVTGTATAWKRSTHVRIPAMPTQLDTLRSSASCTISDILCLVQMGRNGWMVFASAYRWLWCRCYDLGRTHRVNR